MWPRRSLGLLPCFSCQEFSLGSKSKMEIMTVKELAAYLRVGPNTIYRMVKRRQLPVFFVGGGQRFERTAVDQWISSQVNETTRKEG